MRDAIGAGFLRVLTYVGAQMIVGMGIGIAGSLLAGLSLGLAGLSGVPGGDVRNHLQGDFVSIYVPTTPNPTSGFFLMVPRADTIELNMNVDEALKYIVSMGVVAPEHFEGKTLIDPNKVDHIP